jgi:hypothetical protein
MSLEWFVTTRSSQSVGLEKGAYYVILKLDAPKATSVKCR